MPIFQTVHSPRYCEPAPDGSLIYPLLRAELGSIGMIEFHPGRASTPVQHEIIEEIWYVMEGSGQLWRKLGDQEEIVDLQPGTCITIPPHTAFQFRAGGETILRMLMLTMPPWPGDHEAFPVEGVW